MEFAVGHHGDDDPDRGACGFEGLYLWRRTGDGAGRCRRVGLSSFEVDAEAAGIDVSTRGRRADEAIDVLRLLWSAGRRVLRGRRAAG
jgi:hypothetical protein